MAQVLVIYCIIPAAAVLWAGLAGPRAWLSLAPDVRRSWQGRLAGVSLCAYLLGLLGYLVALVVTGSAREILSAPTADALRVAVVAALVLAAAVGASSGTPLRAPMILGCLGLAWFWYLTGDVSLVH